MALTISATDTELQKPVNVAFQELFLRRALPLAPYFSGTKQGQLNKQAGTSTVKWRRINEITPNTTALSELTGTAAYMQGRDAVALAQTDVTATVAKYGQFVILNEEVNLFLPNRTGSEIMGALGESAGRTLNMLQRDIAEDNLTAIRAGNVASDAVVAAIITLGDIKQTINVLEKNNARKFMPMSTGSTNVGTQPVLPAYFAVCHPDVAQDIAGIAGFKSVETYAGQTEVAEGEFGQLGVAGAAVRFVQSSDASIDADAGKPFSGEDLNGTSAIDLYSTVIYGKDALGSVGLGEMHTDGIYRAGDPQKAIQIINKPFGSGGTSDPFDEIQTIAWKSFWAGTVLDSRWGRTIRSGATNLAN